MSAPTALIICQPHYPWAYISISGLDIFVSLSRLVGMSASVAVIVCHHQQPWYYVSISGLKHMSPATTFVSAALVRVDIPPPLFLCSHGHGHSTCTEVKSLALVEYSNRAEVKSVLLVKYMPNALKSSNFSPGRICQNKLKWRDQ